MVLLSAAILFLVYEIVVMIASMRSKKEVEGKLAPWLKGGVLLAAVIGMIKNDIAGYIIWIGDFLLYFVIGIIPVIMRGAPLRFGYGGWELDHKRIKKVKSK